MLLTDPAPASSVFFTFYTLLEGTESGEPEMRVKVSYSETPWDLGSVESLNFTERQQTEPGHISLKEFGDYIRDTLARWA